MQSNSSVPKLHGCHPVQPEVSGLQGSAGCHSLVGLQSQFVAGMCRGLRDIALVTDLPPTCVGCKDLQLVCHPLQILYPNQRCHHPEFSDEIMCQPCLWQAGSPLANTFVLCGPGPFLCRQAALMLLRASVLHCGGLLSFHASWPTCAAPLIGTPVSACTTLQRDLQRTPCT